MKNQIDLLLINPGNPDKIFQSLGAELSAIEPPVWAGLMATFVGNHGFSVGIIDSNAEDMAPREVAKRVFETRPTLVAVVVYGHQPSASTQTMASANEICASIKQLWPESKVLMLGGHVAALPKRTLEEEAVDFAAEGEGLWTLVDLLAALKSNGAFDYRKIRGLFFRDQGQIVSNPGGALIKDLDREMPMMAWELLPMDKYRGHNWHCFGHLKRKPYAAIYTTLGCPYHCSFCCIQAPFKSGEHQAGLKEEVNSYRFWSPETVVQQIDKLVTQYGVRNIKIADEMFVLNTKHVIGICDLIIARGYDLNIWAYARVDTVRDEMIDKLKRAGFNWLAFGIESASEQVRDGVQKGFGQEDIFKTIDRVRQAGINVIGNYIFGLPKDNLDSMQETLDLALELNCEFSNFYCAMAYPGSALYEEAVRNHMALPKTWSGYSQHSVDTLPLPTQYLSAAEVIRFRDRAFQVYFNHPAYLAMIEKKFGPETVQHVREMASHKLERQFA